jgi:hypothetical protein
MGPSAPRTSVGAGATGSPAFLKVASGRGMWAAEVTRRAEVASSEGQIFAASAAFSAGVPQMSRSISSTLSLKPFHPTHFAAEESRVDLDQEGFKVYALVCAKVHPLFPSISGSVGETSLGAGDGCGCKAFTGCFCTTANFLSVFVRFTRQR